MKMAETKHLFLSAYTKDGEHIPVKLLNFVETKDKSWIASIRKEHILGDKSIDDVQFYTLNGKAIRRKSVRKTTDSIHIKISSFDMRHLNYVKASFYEHDLIKVDDLVFDIRFDHFSELSSAQEELIKTEHEMNSKMSQERLIEGYEYWSYCIDAEIVGESTKYPGCHVLRRKYALVDIEDVHAIILKKIESYLLDSENRLYDNGEL